MPIKNKNKLAAFRRKRGFTQRRVMHLLGHQHHGSLSGYESGSQFPELATALKLEIILRTPVAFLFPEIYEKLRYEIRAREDALAGYGQLDLFDHSPEQL